MIDRRSMLILLAAVSAVGCSKPAQAATLNVYKSPSCGCCGAWVDHVKANGFDAVVHDSDDIAPLAASLGVPDQLRSCHTAVIDGYFIEGHVPAADIRKLLRQRPKALGLAVPGMPIGSPGMEQGDQRQPFTTLIVDASGKLGVFARHNQSAVR